MLRRIGMLAALLAITVSACGDGSDDGAGIASLEDQTGAVAAAVDEGVSDAGAELDPEDAMLAFAACMRDQGIDMGDPIADEDGNLRLPRLGGGGGGLPEGLDRDAMLAAREACSEYLDGVIHQFERVDRTDFEDQLLEYAACMRDNGYDMPDPDLSEGFAGGPGQGGSEGGGIWGGLIDREDPAFQAANDVCQEMFADGLMPGGGFGGGQR